MTETALIVVDTSALVAMAQAEPDAGLYAKALLGHQAIAIPASVYLEFAMVMHGRTIARGWLDRWIAETDATVLPITGDTARLAADAFERFGRGTGHPARLNYGDCLSYAVATEHGGHLLFKGADFLHTDVKPAL